jgi:F-type H+-transporting ATPase subunit delta
MLIPRVARRYALAIFEAVPTELGLERFFSDVRDLQRSLEASAELRGFFASPVITDARKREAVEALFAERLTPYTLSVLLFLIEKDRENLLREILASLDDLYRDERGIQTMQVTAARAMDDAQQSALVGVVSAMTKKPVEAAFAADEALIGGLVVRVGDVVYDGSVKRQLQRLRERFLAGTV